MGNKLMLSSAPADALFISSPLVRFASLNKSNLVFLWWHVARRDSVMQLINRQREPLDQSKVTQRQNYHLTNCLWQRRSSDNCEGDTIICTFTTQQVQEVAANSHPTPGNVSNFPSPQNCFFFSKRKFSSSPFSIFHFNLKIKFVFPSAQKRSCHLQLEVSYIHYNILQNYDLVW